MNLTTHIFKRNSRIHLWRPVVLLLVFLIPAGASYLYLNHERHLVRKSVKRMIINGLPDDKLVSLTFLKADSAKAVEWKHSREFRHQGEMYDIVRTEYCGDSIRFICWPDKEETWLNIQISLVFSKAFGNSPQSKKANAQVQHFYLALYFSSIQMGLILPPSCQHPQTPYLESSYQEHLHANDPPPKYIG